MNKSMKDCPTTSKLMVMITVKVSLNESIAIYMSGNLASKGTKSKKKP